MTNIDDNVVMTCGAWPYGTTAQIPLNGGSDTRRAARDYYLTLALVRGVPAICHGNCLIIAGFARIQPEIRTVRGRRCRRIGNTVKWWDRRWLKRFERKGGQAVPSLQLGAKTWVAAP